MHSLYDGARLAAVRTPLLPLKKILEVYAADEPYEALRELLQAMPLVRQAIRVASSGLDDAIEAWCTQKAPPKATVLPRALAYVSRMSARPTPFGICAGIGAVEIGGETTLRIDIERRRTRTRPDMEFVADLAKALESGEHRGKIRYTTNDAVVRRGGRLYVVNILLGSQGHGRTDQRPVTLKETRSVRFVRETATIAVPYDELAVKVATEFGEPICEAHKLLDALIESGILVSELQASPMGDPMAYLLERFHEIDEELAGQLSRAIAGVQMVDAMPVGQRSMKAYTEMVEGFTALTPEPPKAVVQVDMHTPCIGRLSARVLEDVARLGEVFVRMGTDLSLKSFRERFTERYGGRERMVPLLELVDSNLGLGNVADLESVAPAKTEVNALLVRIACDAMRLGVEEIELTDEQLEIIAPRLDPKATVPAVEMAFQVAATSNGAVDEGDYLVVPSGFLAAMGTARSLGRFMDFLGGDTYERARAISEEARTGDLRAEFVYAPLRSRHYNVSIRPRLLATEIQVGVVDAWITDRLALDDLGLAWTTRGSFCGPGHAGAGSSRLRAMFLIHRFSHRTCAACFRSLVKMARAFFGDSRGGPRRR